MQVFRTVLMVVSLLVWLGWARPLWAGEPQAKEQSGEKQGQYKMPDVEIASEKQQPRIRMG